MTDPFRDSPDPGLRRLLEDAVADVEPREGLSAIRARTEGTSNVRPLRPWLLGASAAVVATAATLAVVNLAGGPSPTAGPAPGPAASSTPSPSPSPAPSLASLSPSPSPTSGPGGALPVYYAGDTFQGPRLYREFHAAVGGAGDLAARTVEESVAGTPHDPDYLTLWPAGTHVNHVERSGGTIVVDLGPASLHDRPATMSAAQAKIALQQVIYSAQAAYQHRDPVRLLLDGNVTDSVLGEPTSEPLAQGDASATLAQVWVIDPADGATLASGSTVSGLAAAFEANVQWELRRGTTVVEHGHTTAAQCCVMAPYSFTLTAPPGTYTLVVHDEDVSGAGRPTWQDTKTVTIR